MALEKPSTRAPLSLYVVVGALALFGAWMLFKFIVGMVFSLLTIVVVVAVVGFAVSAVARRGDR